jgi:nucleoid DNA-binding protein
MNYEKLLADVAKRAGLHTEVVRRVLFHLPDSLLQMEVGDDIRTPLGVFRMTQSKARQITLPDQETVATVPAKTIVKLKSGSRLKIEDD